MKLREGKKLSEASERVSSRHVGDFERVSHLLCARLACPTTLGGVAEVWSESWFLLGFLFHPDYTAWFTRRWLESYRKSDHGQILRGWGGITQNWNSQRAQQRGNMGVLPRDGEQSFSVMTPRAHNCLPSNEERNISLFWGGIKAIKWFFTSTCYETKWHN